MEHSEKNILFKVRKTVLEMLKDRGYDIPKKYIISLDEFSLLYDINNINFGVLKKDGTKMYVAFYNENKNFGKNELKDLVQKIKKEYNDVNINIIIILRNKENPSVRREMKFSQYHNIELFIQKNLTFNLTHHELVPKHIILSEDEKNEVFKKYNINNDQATQFPKIFFTDPVAKYYGAKKGQMFKILRKSPFTGEAKYYRIVK